MVSAIEQVRWQVDDADDRQLLFFRARRAASMTYHEIGLVAGVRFIE